MSEPDDHPELQDLGLNTLIRALREHKEAKGNGSEKPDVTKDLKLNDLFLRPVRSQESIAISENQEPVEEFQEVRFEDIISRSTMGLSDSHYGSRPRNYHGEYEDLHELGLRSSFYRPNQGFDQQQFVSRKRGHNQESKELRDLGITPLRRSEPRQSRRSLFAKRSSTAMRSNRNRHNHVRPQPAIVHDRPKRTELEFEDLRLTPVLANYKDYPGYKLHKMAESANLPNADRRQMELRGTSGQFTNTSPEFRDDGDHEQNSRIPEQAYKYNYQDLTDEDEGDDELDDYHSVDLSKLLLEPPYGRTRDMSPRGDAQDIPDRRPEEFVSGPSRRHIKRYPSYGSSDSDEEDVGEEEEDYKECGADDPRYSQNQPHNVSPAQWSTTDEDLMGFSSLRLEDTSRGAIKRKVERPSGETQLVMSPQGGSQLVMSPQGVVPRKIKKVTSPEPAKGQPYINKPINCPMCNRYTLIDALDTHFRVEHPMTPRILSTLGKQEIVGVRLNRIKYGENNCAGLLLFTVDKNPSELSEEYKTAIMIHKMPCNLDFSKYDLMKNVQYSRYAKSDEPVQPEHSELIIIWVCSNLSDDYRFLLTVEDDTESEGRMTYGRVHPIWDKNDIKTVLSRGNVMMIHSSTLKKEPGPLFGFEFQIKVLISKEV